LTVEGRPLEDDPRRDESRRDTELIERARRGDVMAYEELIRTYQDAALRTAAAFAPDGDADDAVQEALVKAYRALDRFRAGSPFRPWLLRIVANEARNRRRSAGRRAGLALRSAEDRRPGEAAPSPESAVLAHEQQRWLLHAIAGLRPDDRDVIAARYFLELNEAETAELLAVPRGTAKSRLARALSRLREILVTTGEMAPGGPSDG
jgi:RNA polymerase sigma-70 factor (ECF subfamily)